MDVLDRARAAGLLVDLDGYCLVIRGPRRLAALGREVRAREDEVVAALHQERVEAAYNAPPCDVDAGLRFAAEVAAGDPLVLAQNALRADWLSGTTAAVAITEALAPDGPGCVLVHSRVLDGLRLLFVRDETVALPPEHAGLVTFTRDELAQLVRDGVTGDALRALYKWKSEFPGARVVAPETTKTKAFAACRTDPWAPTQPSQPCPACRQRQWWRQAASAWMCAVCHPGPRRPSEPR